MALIDNPTFQKNRIQELDVFRGFAIFGIFMVNILVMNASFMYRGEWVTEQTGAIQAIALFILENFFFSKFFVIFSLLFGMGVALQIEKFKSHGQFSNAFFLRRFGSLFVFGLAHTLFLWSGDILHIYGLFGFFLLFFFRFSTRTVLWLAILIFLFPFYHILFVEVIEWVEFDYEAPLSALSREELLELKHNGSYLSGIRLRLKEYLFVMSFVYSGIAPTALAMMLLGGYLVKKGFLENISSWVDRTKVYLFISAFALLIYRFVLLYWVVPTFDIQFGSAASNILMTFFSLSDLSLSLLFLWIIAALMRSVKWQKILSPLSYVGRTALSNYILQSVLGYLIMRTFNGYEYFSAASCIALVLLIFSFQMVLSKFWLSRFKFGPLEWFWRCVSYKRFLTIRKSAAPA